MSYLNLFSRYGSPSREAEVRFSAYLVRPDVLTADRIKAHDESAARTIAQCQALIEQLTDYRKALARFAALKRQRPGLEAVEDIAKRSWER